MGKKSRLLWSLVPLACGLLLPPVLAFWVNSHRLRHSWLEAAQTVVSDYYRPLGDSLALTTALHLPPFIVLAIICFFARTTRRKLIGLLVLGLALICLVQIPITIRMLKRILEGEAEFVAAVYVTNSLMSMALLALGMFIAWICRNATRTAEGPV